VHPDRRDVPESLPTNVVPLRGVLPYSSPQRARQSVPVPPPNSMPAAAPLEPSTLVEADPTNPEHKPSPIFGRATLNLPEWPLILVFVGIVIALGVAVADSFRLGSVLFGGALVLAFFLRLVLTDREAGMLKVRSRLVDLFVLGGFAVGILVLTLALPL